MSNITPNIGYWAKYLNTWYKILEFDEDKGTFLGYGLWVCSSKFEDVSRTKPKPFACPICGSKILVDRRDDGETFYTMDNFTGELTELDGWSNGRTSIYCSKNTSHELGDIEDKVYTQI